MQIYMQHKFGKKTGKENDVDKQSIYGRLRFSEYPHCVILLQLRLACYLISMISHNFINTDISCEKKAEKFKTHNQHVILILMRNE